MLGHKHIAGELWRRAGWVEAVPLCECFHHAGCVRVVHGGLQENPEGIHILAWCECTRRARQCTAGAAAVCSSVVSVLRRAEPSAVCRSCSTSTFPDLQEAFVLLNCCTELTCWLLDWSQCVKAKIGLRWQLKNRNSTV